MMKKFIPFICTLIFLFVPFTCSFLFLGCSSSSEVEYPYYRIDQVYNSFAYNGSTYFDIKTLIIKVNGDSKYSWDNDHMYIQESRGIRFDKVDSCLLSDYDKALLEIEKYEHVDQLIDKNYESKEN